MFGTAPESSIRLFSDINKKKQFSKKTIIKKQFKNLRIVINFEFI